MGTKLDELMLLTNKILGIDYNKKNYTEDEYYNRDRNSFKIFHKSKNKDQLDFLFQIARQGHAIEKELCKDKCNKKLVKKLLENMYDIIEEYMNNSKQNYNKEKNT